METYNRDEHIHGIEEYQEQIETTTARDFSIGLGIGLAIGTVAGLLLAPKSGEALRDDISGQITDQTEKLQKTFNSDETNENGKSLKERAEEKTEELRAKLNEKKDEFVAKKAENDSKNDFKNLDENTVQAQRNAIRHEAKDDELTSPSSIDVSKFEESLDGKKDK